MFAHSKKRHIPLAVLLLFLFLAPAGGAAKPPVTYTLPNGLEIILLENHRAPVVSALVWVKVGSALERKDEFGLAHLMEHMLFKGTATRGPGEVARQIEAGGGNINAYTSFDQTVYYFDIASRFASTGLEVLADMIFNPAFEPLEFQREKEVVIEEIKRSRDIPARRLSESLFGEAYRVHPYGRPIIGYADSVRGVSRETAISFHRRWYAPRNMVLVIAGDFHPDEIKPLVKTVFGQAESRDISAERPAGEPAQEDSRVVIIHEDVKEARMGLAFHIPEIKSDDIKVLDLLSVVLGQGRTSRLYRKVKYDRELVHQVHATAFTPKEPGLFYIDSTLSPKQVVPALEAILDQTYGLTNAAIRSEELDRARLRIKADFIRARATMSGEARVAASFTALMGDLEAKDRYLADLDKVTLLDMKQVAAKYLRPENLTAALVLPKEGAEDLTEDRVLNTIKKHEPPPEQSAAASSSNDTGRIESKASEAGNQVPSGSGAGEADEPEVKKYTLSNGATILVKADHSLPLVAIRAAFLGGVRFETAENSGLNNFLAEVWDKGTHRLSARELAEAVEDMAGRISSFSGRNSFGLEAEFLSQFLEPGLELLTDVLLNPAFNDNEVEMARADILAAIKRQEEDLIRRAFNLFSKNLYGRHPYAMKTLGTPESIQKISAEMLKAYYRKWAVPENMVMAVVGDVDPGQIKDRLEKTLGSWRGNKFSAPAIDPPVALKAPQAESDQIERAQAHLVLGFLAAGLNSQDRYALEVLDRVLSGQGGRLFVDLRDKQSLAYTVSSVYRPGLDTGAFGFYIAFDPDKYDQVKLGLTRAVQDISKNPVSAEELDRAKKNILGYYEIGLQRNTSQAADLAFNELYGLGYNYHYKYIQGISDVTADMVLNAARRYLDLGRSAAVTVGPVKPWEVSTD